jgi:hypothetical protein
VQILNLLVSVVDQSPEFFLLLLRLFQLALKFKLLVDLFGQFKRYLLMSLFKVENSGLFLLFFPLFL